MQNLVKRNTELLLFKTRKQIIYICGGSTFFIFIFPFKKKNIHKLFFFTVAVVDSHSRLELELLAMADHTHHTAADTVVGGTAAAVLVVVGTAAGTAPVERMDLQR